MYTQLYIYLIKEFISLKSILPGYSQEVAPEL